MWGLGLRASSLPAPSSLEGTCAQLAHFLSVTRGPGPPGPVSLCRQCLSPPSLDRVTALTPAVPRSHLGHHQDLDFRLGALHHLPVSSALPRTPVPQPSRTPCWPAWLGSCLEAWASITTHLWVGPASPRGGGRHPWLGISAPQPSPWQCPPQVPGHRRPRGAASRGGELADFSLFQTAVLQGRVRIRDWRQETPLQERQPEARRRVSSEAFKTRLCWFFLHHPDGCVLPADRCPFAHGPGELRPPPAARGSRPRR